MIIRKWKQRTPKFESNNYPFLIIYMHAHSQRFYVRKISTSLRKHENYLSGQKTIGRSQGLLVGQFLNQSESRDRSLAFLSTNEKEGFASPTKSIIRDLFITR